MERIAGILDPLLGAWTGPLLFLALAVLLYLGALGLFGWFVGLARRRGYLVGLPLKLMAWPFRLVVVLAGSSTFIEYAPLPASLVGPLNHLFLILSIVAAAWFILRLLALLEAFVMSHYQAKSRLSEAAARKVATHVSLARKIFTVLVILLAVSGVLMTFDTVRQVGLSILASAGIAGVILGFAAQKSLATLIAGIQIAISQPISIDDVVIVEGEWGRIEEITLT